MNTPKKFLFLFLSILFYMPSAISSIKEQYPFASVVIWGHKIQSGHTHSWIHYAFYKAFRHLGYNTLWLDNNDVIAHIDFSNSLFITEGQVDQNIPKRADCRYILHNCTRPPYQSLFEQDNCLLLQVFTYDVLERDVREIAPFIFTDLKQRIMYMPWATDLLPHEIDQQKQQVSLRKKSDIIYWVGTLCHGTFGNWEEITPFMTAAQNAGIRFQQHKDQNAHNCMTRIQQSYMAPAIVGTWQKEKGYIPCRIFKNISYGQMGITNSKAVSDLFEGKIVYNPNTYQLFFDAQQKLATMDLQELHKMMDFVRDHHTYITRIKQLLGFMNDVKPIGH